MTNTGNAENRARPRAARAPSKRSFHSTGVINTIKTSVEDEFSSYKTEKAPKSKSPFPYATVLTAVVCTILLMLIVVSYVQLSQLQRDVNLLEREMSSIEDVDDKLNSALDQKYMSAEESARQLGMVSLSNSQTVYLQSGNEDVAGSVNKENSLKKAFSSFWSSVENAFEDVIEYLN